jgi:hypothetical protein
MISLDEQIEIAEQYSVGKLSVQQISENLGRSWYQIDKVLEKQGVEKRSIAESARALHITKFGLGEFKIKENLSHEEELLKIAGVMLYWGEGTKERGNVALSNSDPRIIKLFVRFMRIICGIDPNRLHATIHYYEDHDPEKLTAFWSEVTKIPVEQFYKPFLHPRASKGTYRKPSLHGTISIQYSDTLLLKQIQAWMTEYADLGTRTI